MQASSSSVWPDDWSLDVECSTRPAAAIHIAFRVIRLVAQKQDSLDGLFAEVLALQLGLQFAKALQKKWSPSKRVRDVLYCFGECQRQGTLPGNSKVLEMQFYKHGGLLALAALGLAMSANNSKGVGTSILKDLGMLTVKQRVSIIESIKDYPRDPSVDRGLQDCLINNFVRVSEHSYFQRHDRSQQLCLSCQTILGHTTFNVLSTPPASSRKRPRISGDSPDGCLAQVTSASHSASQSSNGVTIHAWTFQKPVHQPIAQNEGQSQSRAICPMVQSTTSAPSTVPRVEEAQDPINTQFTQFQLPVEEQGRLGSGLTGTKDPSGVAAPVALEVPAAAEEHDESGDWTTSHGLVHWKSVQIEDPDAQNMQRQSMAYSDPGGLGLAEEQEENRDWTTSHEANQWKSVQFKGPYAQYMQRQNMEYTDPGGLGLAGQQEESDNWTTDRRPMQFLPRQGMYYKE